jgi:hypothetical protein
VRTTVAYQHTNRKGATYYLHRRERNGKARYVFARKLGDGAIEAIPQGYEVRESVNGQVSLAKVTERQIIPAEEATVRKLLPETCRLELKGRQIIVFEPANGAGGSAGDPWLQRAMAAHLAKNARYEPVMKFELLDRDERTFEVARWHYSGEEGWTHPLETGPLVTLAEEFLPHIGKQSFYDLM